MLKAPQRRLWWSCPHTNHLVVLRAQWSAVPPLIAQKRRLLSRAFGIAVGGSGLRLLISEQLALGAASRRSMPPTGPPAASQGRPTVLHQPRSARTAAAKQLRASHRGAAALLSARPQQLQVSPGRGAPRPVSPGTAALAADARGARRPADALNELRPLRQRVSRAAGICLPAAAGCQRSSARRCRQSAARCRRPGRRSSSPTTHHLRT